MGSIYLMGDNGITSSSDDGGGREGGSLLTLSSG